MGIGVTVELEVKDIASTINKFKSEDKCEL